MAKIGRSYMYWPKDQFMQPLQLSEKVTDILERKESIEAKIDLLLKELDKVQNELLESVKQVGSAKWESISQRPLKLCKYLKSTVEYQISLIHVPDGNLGLSHPYAV